MIFTLAFRSLFTRPVRSAVLAGGFGLGVSVMAALLGIGGVILEQSRAPELGGGGDVIIGSNSGRLASAKFVVSGVLGSGALASRVAVVAPTSRATLYLIDSKGATPIRARGGIPSRERALQDPETAGVAAWTDAPEDRAWTAPDQEDVLREMDRFHTIPDVPARARSWAEWLYFNGRAGTARFYLTFLAGPRQKSGRRMMGVRLQLDREGRVTSYAESTEVDEDALISSAPDITVGRNRVRLVGREYRITIDLPDASGSARASGDIVVRASQGRSLPPFSIKGAGGWVTGYVVPVMTGELEGSIQVVGGQVPVASAFRRKKQTTTTGRHGSSIDLGGGTGYHDHNWGFWEGVSWQWGQVQANGLSYVYGRVNPPADAAEASRIPGFLAAIGPDGPIGYATDVTIEETNRPGTAQPQRIVVRASSESLALTFDLAVDQVTVTPIGEGIFGAGLDFLQLRAQYRVTGQAGNQRVDFTAPGSAETFRGGR